MFTSVLLFRSFCYFNDSSPFFFLFSSIGFPAFWSLSCVLQSSIKSSPFLPHSFTTLQLVNQATTIVPPFHHHSTTILPTFRHHVSRILPPNHHHSISIPLQIFNQFPSVVPTILRPFYHHSTTIIPPFASRASTATRFPRPRYPNEIFRLRCPADNFLYNSLWASAEPGRGRGRGRGRRKRRIIRWKRKVK